MYSKPVSIIITTRGGTGNFQLKNETPVDYHKYFNNNNTVIVRYEVHLNDANVSFYLRPE